MEFVNISSKNTTKKQSKTNLTHFNSYFKNQSQTINSDELEIDMK